MLTSAVRVPVQTRVKSTSYNKDPLAGLYLGKHLIQGLGSQPKKP